MLKRLWEEIESSWELLNNGVDMEGCRYGHLYCHRDTREFAFVGFDEQGNVIRIQIANEPNLRI